MPKLRKSEGGAKKRYAGLVVKDGKEEIKFTGLESVRGDWTELAKKYQQELLDRVFHNKDVADYTKTFVNDLKNGKFVIVIDDKRRENEADLVLAAEKTTPQKINFMIKNAGGLICVPMLGKRLDRLKLPLMAKINTELHKTAFTVSVDSKNGTTTGI